MHIYICIYIYICLPRHANFHPSFYTFRFLYQDDHVRDSSPKRNNKKSSKKNWPSAVLSNIVVTLAFSWISWLGSGSGVLASPHMSPRLNHRIAMLSLFFHTKIHEPKYHQIIAYSQAAIRIVSERTEIGIAENNKHAWSYLTRSLIHTDWLAASYSSSSFSFLVILTILLKVIGHHCQQYQHVLTCRCFSRCSAKSFKSSSSWSGEWTCVPVDKFNRSTPLKYSCGTVLRIITLWYNHSTTYIINSKPCNTWNCWTLQLALVARIREAFLVSIWPGPLQVHYVFSIGYGLCVPRIPIRFPRPPRNAMRTWPDTSPARWKMRFSHGLGESQLPQAFGSQGVWINADWMDSRTWIISTR